MKKLFQVAKLICGISLIFAGCSQAPEIIEANPADQTQTKQDNTPAVVTEGAAATITENIFMKNQFKSLPKTRSHFSMKSLIAADLCLSAAG